jgi:hypothetical protein
VNRVPHGSLGTGAPPARDYGLGQRQAIANIE